MQHAERVLVVGVEPRIAAELGSLEFGEDFLLRHALVQAGELLAGAQEVADHQLGQLQRVAHHGDFLAAVADAAVAVQYQLELVTRERLRVLVGVFQPEPAQDQEGAGVEHPDGRVHHPVKDIERRRSPCGRVLRTADGQRFRRQFAQHDMQE